MFESYKWDGMGMGWDGRKSLKALILRAPLCGANNLLIRQMNFSFFLWTGACGGWVDL